MAKELCIIKTGPISFDAYTLEDQDRVKPIKIGRVVKIKSTDIQTQSNIHQLNLYWAACHFTAERTDDENISHKYKIDSHLRVKFKFFDIDKCVYDGNKIYFEIMSIGLKNLKHAIKTNYFNNCFEWMANEMDMKVDKFIEEVKATMKRR